VEKMTQSLPQSRVLSRWPSARIAEIVHQRSAPKTFGVNLFTEEQRRAALIGRKVNGQLIRSEGGYFVKWNMWKADSIFVNEKVVLRDCSEIDGLSTMMGALAEVECTIQSLGPSYAQWEKQHPCTNQLTVARCFTKDMTEIQKEEFRTALYLDRQNMPIGPCGSSNGNAPVTMRQRSAPNLLIIPGRDRSQTYPRPPLNGNSAGSTPGSRSRAGSSETRTRSRAGSANSQASAGYSPRSRSGAHSPRSRSRSTGKGIKFCRPRRHVPVAETPGAYLAQDLNEFRRKQTAHAVQSPRPFAPKFQPEFQPEFPQFRQQPSVGKTKGGKPMNMRFGAQFSHNVGQFRNDGSMVPERFRHLNESPQSSPRTRVVQPPAGVSWRSKFQSVLKPHGDSTGSSTSSVEQAGAKRLAFTFDG